MAVDLGAMLSRQLPAEGRNIEIITKEILENKAEAGKAIIQIGRCLEEAKALLGHGEWLPWLQEQVELTERQAQRFMRLSREWSNPTTLSDLGASKALSLLALEPAERDEFLAQIHEVDGEEKTVIDMSARELEQAIRERKSALEAKAAAEADKQQAERARDKLSDEMKLANARIESLSETEAHLDGVIADLKKGLAELQSRPIDANFSEVPDTAALDAARQEGADQAAKTARKDAEDRLRAKIEKAEKAKADADAQAQTARAEREAAQAKADTLEKQLKLVSNPAATEFKVHFESTKKDVASMEDCLERMAATDPAICIKLAGAMEALGRQIQTDAEARQSGGGPV